MCLSVTVGPRRVTFIKTFHKSQVKIYFPKINQVKQILKHITTVLVANKQIKLQNLFAHSIKGCFHLLYLLCFYLQVYFYLLEGILQVTS